MSTKWATEPTLLKTISRCPPFHMNKSFTLRKILLDKLCCKNVFKTSLLESSGSGTQAKARQLEQAKKGVKKVG